jgi:hypothetical protein
MEKIDNDFKTDNTKNNMEKIDNDFKTDNTKNNVEKINATYEIFIGTDVDFAIIEHINLKRRAYKTMSYKEYLKKNK